MAARKKKPAGAPESAKALEAAMNENQVPERPPGDTIQTGVEGDPPKKRARKRQADLPGVTGPGVEKPSFPEVDEVCESYEANKSKRIKFGKLESDDKKKLIGFMHAKNLTCYESDDKVYQLVPKDETETLKVVAKADYQTDAGGEPGDEEPAENLADN